MNIPFVNAYGCLQTSQVFFLLWASQVVRLKERLDESNGGIILHTNLDECSVSCPSICKDGIGVDRAPLGHYISDMYLKRKIRAERGDEEQSGKVSDLVLLLLALVQQFS